MDHMNISGLVEIKTWSNYVFNIFISIYLVPKTEPLLKLCMGLLLCFGIIGWKWNLSSSVFFLISKDFSISSN